MIYSVEFLTENANHVSDLYFYCLLRQEGYGKAGYFGKMNLTHHQKYKKLKKLRDLGWVHKDCNRVISHRKIIKAQNKHNFKMCRINPAHLKTLNSFKGFIISIAEHAQLDWRWRLQEGKLRGYSYRDKMFYRKQVNVGSSIKCGSYNVTKFSGEESGFLSGRVSNFILSRSLGITVRSVSTWRKYSSNKYKLNKQVVSGNSVKYGDTKAYYSKKNRVFIHVDMVIVSDKEVFTNKYTKDSSIYSFFNSSPYNTVSHIQYTGK